MPAGFTKSLAERLDYSSQVTVKEAEDNDPILPGYVYIAPGNYHLEITGSGPQRVISLNQKPPVGSHRPAVDPTFESVVQYGSDVVSVILTGMGCDGSAGMKKIKEAGGYVIAESKESCVVYGMPKAVVDAGIADEVLPVEQVADAIVNAVRK
jgi:two-component system chemotaxis response regulator CheB